MHPSTKIFSVYPGQEIVNPFIDSIPRKMSFPCVYVVDMIGTPFVKIGSTSNPRSRIGSYQVVSPFEIRCAFILCPPVTSSHIHIEMAVQAKLNEQVERGEWFHLSALDAIEAIRREI